MTTPITGDPEHVGPAPGSTGGRKGAAPSYSKRPGAPIGVPSIAIQTPSADGKSFTTTYQSNYTPPLWIQGQGPAQNPGPYWGAPGTTGTGQGPQFVSTQPNFYVEGDEYAPGGDPTSVPGIKAQLIQSGLLDPAKQSSGSFWGQAEADAYTTALTYANRYGVDATTMLSWLADHPAAPQIQLSNVLDINSLAKSVIAPLIGKDLSAAQMTKFTNDFHRWEAANAQNAAQPTAASTVEKPADATSFATGWATQNLGAAEQSHSMLGYLNQIVSMAGPTVSTGGG